MEKTLRIIVHASAVLIIAVSLMHVTLGQSWVPDTTDVTPSLDSEHRFYTTLFLGYGIALFWTARKLSDRVLVFYALLAVLFVGGLARIVSVLAAGWPHPMFIALGGLELAVPPLLWVLTERTFRQPTQS